MGIATTVAQSLHKSMKEQDLSAAWVARESGVRYKRVLGEVVHRTTALRLETAIAVAAALGVEIDGLVTEHVEKALGAVA